jgi:hypothetical protein
MGSRELITRKIFRRKWVAKIAFMVTRLWAQGSGSLFSGHPISRTRGGGIAARQLGEKTMI